ncbi:hypothetical protein [Methylocaldum szegediense]|uniref:Lipoprotein n=1 Tax=Methylocaldum szegediense TaxID=73780 RepID=A0ABN8WZ74_9GAMM|nr:hypothetical protein [Methylocaldum szegediense]CAI8773788.1 conserved protein of unknown function [Methylocaldum szegediense]
MSGWPNGPDACRRVSLGLAILAAAGCAIDPAKLNSLSDLEVCRGYAVYSAWVISNSRADQYRREIERRHLLTPQEWALVEQKRIEKGMSRCALYASWGVPVSEEAVEGEKEEIRHVYHSGWLMSPGAVYTKNGKVEAWAY